MELKKKFKKIGFIFGLKREMKLVSQKNNNIICVYGYGKASKNAAKELIKFGVDIVINFGFAGSISKSLKNGDIVFIDKLFNEKKEKVSNLKFDKDLIRHLENNFKIKFYKEIFPSDQNNKIVLTEKLNKVLENMIIDNPSEWIWTHNRWK